MCFCDSSTERREKTGRVGKRGQRKTEEDEWETEYGKEPSKQDGNF